MTKHRAILLKIILPVLFALAVLLGLYQSGQDPYVSRGTINNTPLAGDRTTQEELRAYYNKANDLADHNDLKTTATFLAVGDIMLSRNVAGTVKKANDPLLPFRNMGNVLKSTDFNFGNLESPFTGSDAFNPSGTLVFNAPTYMIRGLIEYNFKILNLANNHALDQGLKGLQHTKKYLNDNGIKSIGVGSDLDEAWQPEIIEANGIKIGFLGASYASINDNGKTKNNYVARMEDVENLKLEIEDLKLRSDFVVVTMHAGTEYVRKPHQGQIDFAYAAIDAGADMVIGAHPHWVQTVEKYCPLQSSPPILGGVPRAEVEGGGGITTSTTTPSRQSTGHPSYNEGSIANCPNPKYIFYSLGNFIFDQEWSRDTKEGLAIKIRISKPEIRNQTTPGAATLSDLQGPKIPAVLESIELIPVVIENYSTPRPANPNEAKAILEKIGVTESILR